MKVKLEAYTRELYRAAVLISFPFGPQSMRCKRTHYSGTKSKCNMHVSTALPQQGLLTYILFDYPDREYLYRDASGVSYQCTAFFFLGGWGTTEGSGYCRSQNSPNFVFFGLPTKVIQLIELSGNIHMEVYSVALSALFKLHDDMQLKGQIS